MARLRELDALRGIAAVLVLVHHNTAATTLLQGSLRDLVKASPLQVVVNGRPAVLFFFVLSGFVLSHALSRTGLTFTECARWGFQRSVRLLVPAAAAVLVSAALYLLTHRGTWEAEAIWLRDTVWNQPLRWDAVIAQATLTAADGSYGLLNVLWSLAIEWRISLLLPLVAIPAMFSGARGALSLLLLGLGVACFFGGAASEGLYAGASLSGAARATLYFILPFVIGVALHRSGASRLQADRLSVAYGMVAVLGLARMGNDLAVYAASAILIWAAQQPGALRNALRHPALVWVGTVSFSLYLIHAPVLAALHHTLHDALHEAAIYALGLAAAFPAAWLFYLVVERPSHRLARLAGRLPEAVRMTLTTAWRPAHYGKIIATAARTSAATPPQ